MPLCPSGEAPGDTDELPDLCRVIAHASLFIRGRFGGTVAQGALEPLFCVPRSRSTTPDRGEQPTSP